MLKIILICVAIWIGFGIIEIPLFALIQSKILKKKLFEMTVYEAWKCKDRTDVMNMLLCMFMGGPMCIIVLSIIQFGQCIPKKDYTDIKVGKIFNNKLGE